MPCIVSSSFSLSQSYFLRSRVERRLLLSHECPQRLVLVCGDHVHPGIDGGAPPCVDSGARTEIVGCPPSLVLRGSKAVESIEANPVAEAVGTVHQGLQSLVVGFGPVAS